MVKQIELAPAANMSQCLNIDVSPPLHSSLRASGGGGWLRWAAAAGGDAPGRPGHHRRPRAARRRPAAGDDDGELMTSARWCWWVGPGYHELAGVARVYLLDS